MTHKSKPTPAGAGFYYGVLKISCDPARRKVHISPRSEKVQRYPLDIRNSQTSFVPCIFFDRNDGCNGLTKNKPSFRSNWRWIGFGSSAKSFSNDLVLNTSIPRGGLFFQTIHEYFRRLERARDTPGANIVFGISFLLLPGVVPKPGLIRLHRIYRTKYNF